MTILLLCLAVAAESYLLGSIDAGILVSKFLFRDDVRTHGSGNAGMTNILRTYGKASAALTALGDGLKGVLAVYIAAELFGHFVMQTGVAPLCGEYLALIFAVIGHMKPLYFGFKGGKGVMVAAGCVLAINPAVALVLLVLFAVVFAVTRMVSLCSVLVAACLPVLTFLYGYFVQRLTPRNLLVATLCTALVAAMVIYMHRSNLQRIKDGTEYRFDGSHHS